ncbi:hypothetical protein MCC10043_0243 [Bifidobacterium longum subsp. longum]|uniref:Uncharacterized protein n=1 Tax=Bifidobacterium longum subsp. longum TaxID=1679 RepID=A0AB38IIE0_BIFLL|nr:hypothetical protein [Bifidobacterium longum]TCE02701.1 hypothetical protein MCC10017_0280 [Bifidobacterium longum subsp. longum]TCE42203.1 hypothetical protein MCC10043_0243 [Bifidobacterium longum subsp. longum]TCE53923.1 hypothetical protein MCC10048_0250 [Bifidobacterium longum subsp. longum]TCE82672.1 hypothetical protein MCC10068_0260 [Bifidobacterium longum subsp. longum]TCF22735.1 hypothetical protein MCC10090_0346 [Bifidobacterium longum subsp. longum]
MANSAQYLIGFFDRDKAETGEYRINVVSAAMNDLERVTRAGAAIGTDLCQEIVGDIPQIWQHVILSFVDKEPRWDDKLRWKCSPTPITKVGLPKDLHKDLVMAAQTLPFSSPDEDERKKRDVRELIVETAKAIQDDPTLPQNVRVYILRLLKELSTALEESDKAMFILDDAINRLVAALTMAETVSKKPERIHGLLNKFLPTLGVALMTSIIGMPFQIATAAIEHELFPPEQNTVIRIEGAAAHQDTGPSQSDH